MQGSGHARGAGHRRLRVLVRAGLVLLLLAALGFALLTRDPTPRILERRGQLVQVRAEPELRVAGLLDQEVEIVSSSGLAVQLGLRKRLEPATRRPAVLLLGGHRTGKGASELVEDPRDAIVVALSYPTDVRRIESLADALDARRAILDTPAAVMLAMDYLCSRPDVDAQRVELVGVSLGAIFACVAAGLDDRFHRVWAIHGGGDLQRLFEVSLRREIDSALVRHLAAFGIRLIGHGFPFAPERWVERIAPRPFVMVNAREDARIPTASVELLFAAAREPKELHWLPGDHVHPKREEQVRALCDLVLERVHREP